MALPPLDLIAATTASTSSRDVRAFTATAAPSRASRSAISADTPRAAGDERYFAGERAFTNRHCGLPSCWYS